MPRLDETTPVFLNILVAVDGSSAARTALAQAVDLARCFNARLTLVAVAPEPSQFVALSGTSSELLRDELADWAARILREATASLPDDVAAHTIQRTGDPGEQIVAELERGAYDLLVLGSRGRGRARSNLLGSVNTHAHYHSDAAILSVKEDE